MESGIIDTHECCSRMINVLYICSDTLLDSELLSNGSKPDISESFRNGINLLPDYFMFAARTFMNT